MVGEGTVVRMVHRFDVTSGAIFVETPVLEAEERRRLVRIKLRHAPSPGSGADQPAQPVHEHAVLYPEAARHRNPATAPSRGYPVQEGKIPRISLSSQAFAVIAIVAEIRMGQSKLRHSRWPGK